jgi:hypothetical protein
VLFKVESIIINVDFILLLILFIGTKDHLVKTINHFIVIIVIIILVIIIQALVNFVINYC